MRTNRELAMEWWQSLGDDIGYIADKYHKGCETIQENQIEEIWRKETQINTIKDNIIYFKEPTVFRDKIVLYGAGKFCEERLILDRNQAMLALIALTKFLYNDKTANNIKESLK